MTHDCPLSILALDAQQKTQVGSSICFFVAYWPIAIDLPSTVIALLRTRSTALTYTTDWKVL